MTERRAVVPARRQDDREIQELRDMIYAAASTAEQAARAVSHHEELCAVRQAALLQRMSRVENAIYAAIGFALASGVIAKVFF